MYEGKMNEMMSKDEVQEREVIGSRGKSRMRKEKWKDARKKSK